MPSGLLARAGQRRWIWIEQYKETFALRHFLPGPKIVNLSIVFGSRFHGMAGGGCGLFPRWSSPPMVISRIFAALYARYGEVGALPRDPARVCLRARLGLLIATLVWTFGFMSPFCGWWCELCHSSTPPQLSPRPNGLVGIFGHLYCGCACRDGCDERSSRRACSAFDLADGCSSLALAADRSSVAGLTASAAAQAFATRINPL